MTLLAILSDGFFAAVAAVGFGAVSDPPMRAFPAIALLAAVGHAGAVGEAFVTPDQVLIDVGINVNAEGKLCGDVAPEAAQKARASTPVPGGVGSVTTTVLAKHVIEAAQRTLD